MGGNLIQLTTQQWIAGDTSSAALRQQLTIPDKSSLGRAASVATVHTSWTMIGHLDELFALASFTAAPGKAAEYYLFYADPTWGLQLFREMQVEERRALLQSTREEETRWGGIDLGAQLANEQRQDFSAAQDLNHPDFRELVAANTTYAEIIMQDLPKFKEIIPPGHIIKLPILLVPAAFQNSYGTPDDLAVAAYANSVNFWAGANIIITAQWPWPVWQQAVAQQMQKFPGKTFYLDAAVLNQRRGGLHCFTNEVAPTPHFPP